MAHLGITNAAAQGIPWDQLIEFANNKKAEEQSTGKPAQLSKQQLAAVSMLVDFVKDIEVDDNYVSRLNEYCQQHKITGPQFTTETFNQCISGTNVPRSRVLCTLPCKNQQFPQEGYGFSAGEAIPTFKKAQKAKNFAAMQALNWLRGEGPSSPRGEKRPASVTQESTVHTKIKAEEDNNSDGGVLTVDSSKPSEEGVPAPVAPVVAQGPTVRDQVAKLSDDMDFGAFAFHMERENEENDVWKGRPIFKNDMVIPSDMGAVTGVAGRQQAEDLVAQKALEWLESEKRARMEAFEKIMSPRPE